MKRRDRVLGGIALLLVLMNVWRWTGSQSTGSSGPGPTDAAAELAGQELVLRTASVEAVPSTPARDLFQVRVAVANRPRIPVAPQPPPKTPEEIAEDQARAELAQIKLLGVVFRGGLGEAFLLANGTSVAARIGARVGNRFIVERITPEVVDVRDPDTQVSGQLALSER